MPNELQFYIDGRWVDPVAPNALDVIDSSTEDAFAQISRGSKADVDKEKRSARSRRGSCAEWDLCRDGQGAGRHRNFLAGRSCGTNLPVSWNFSS